MFVLACAGRRERPLYVKYLGRNNNCIEVRVSILSFFPIMAPPFWPIRHITQGVPMSKLSEAEIIDRLPTAKGWDRHGDMLVRTWQFPSFRRAMEFVNQVAILLEKSSHHPDLIVQYRTVRIEMSTHDVGGLTERDFALIAEINEIPTRSLKAAVSRADCTSPLTASWVHGGK